MRNFKRMLAVTLTLMMITLAGCSGNKTSESSAVGTTEGTTEATTEATTEQNNKASEDVYQVHFYAWTNPDNVKPLEEAFNKEYAGKYQFVYEKLADAKTLTINTALASGEKIDVMTQSSGFDQRQRSDGGAYMGLKQFFDKEGWDYADTLGDAIEETQNINGDYYAIPYCNNINMVYFNKKMFDAAGVEYPKTGWTWQDFRDTAAKLTSGEGANKVYGAMIDAATPGGDYYWDLIARQKLGNFAYYNEDKTASTFDSPEMKESLQFFVDMALKDKSIVPLDEINALKYTDEITAMQGLYNGKFAMWIEPVYGNLYLKDSYGAVPEGTDIGMVNMPTLDGGQTITTCYTSTASIPSNVENPEAAWALLKFITIDHPELFAGPKGMNSAVEYKTEEEIKSFNELIFDHGNRPGLDYDMAMKTMSEPRTLVSKDNTLIQGQAKITEVMDAVMTLVFNGEMSPDEGLAELKTKVDAAIKEDLASMK
ncbi:extracellular solute-binding protein [Anaerocolumna sedimenticola]|uniref:Extracellular solute-binding protein n=1 Tax=Anaerocolumna sedimenticola TaxID=2696063 RepID=A0A6P1THQ7_9FIRM|nr:extracellular solute-binding protein [Anaerocolumna sedimenticola]QHQ59632.1 extracellular solute-binding protein [Anaerocolumna sedimenticola]